MSTERLGADERALIARMVAADLPDGAYVNLGIGLPVTVADLPLDGREVVFHSENGLLGIGPRPPLGTGDPDIINASKQVVTVLPGVSFMSHCDSFAIIRGGHLDVTVLGAYQVSKDGDLANWSVGSGVTGIGGAMDLALGSKEIWVTMHLGQRAAERLVDTCTYPLTAKRVVGRVYTELGSFEVRNGAFWLRELAPGCDERRVRATLDPALIQLPLP